MITSRHSDLRLFLVLALWSVPLAAQTHPAFPAIRPQAGATYVGIEVCQGCHEDTFNAFQHNPHIAVQTYGGHEWNGKACEACHGPGSKHAESMSATDITNPKKALASQTDRICLGCHLNQSTNVGRIHSSHAKNQVGCTTCHTIHKTGPDELVVKRVVAVNELCTNCHVDVWASFQRPYRHRLPEGAMSCIDCHNPHGNYLPGNMQTANANEPGCMRCHGNLRGPFIFEHAPVKLEGCGACHQPHGSANPRMLTRAQVQFVCLECHANLPGPTSAANGTIGTVPPALHDLRSPRFQNCTTCHQKVHGSYVDRNFFK
jgi:DmsE family decaheme c-type cytochrome